MIVILTSVQQFHLDVQEDQLRLHGIGPGHKDFGVDPESHYGTLIHIAQERAEPQVRKFPTVTPATYVEYYRAFARALNGQGEVLVKASEAQNATYDLPRIMHKQQYLF